MPEQQFFICQVSGHNTDLLVCPHRESGGYQCERLMPHPDDKHFFGQHTIEHDRAGNGYSCRAFYEVPAMLPLPDLTDEEKDLAEKVSYEIHNARYPVLRDHWNPAAGTHWWPCWDGECAWDAAWRVYTQRVSV